MSADCGCGGTCPMCRYMHERVSGGHIMAIAEAVHAAEIRRPKKADPKKTKKKSKKK